MPMKVIVDVDTGVDDAAALLLLLSQKDVEVLAITCVKGNVDVDKCCINTLRVLKVCGRSEVPVYRGAERALLDCKSDAGHYHGRDGLGNTTWSEEEAVDISDIQSEHAVNAIIRLARKFPGEITLIPLGPLTNIALALRMEPSLGDKLKEVFIMGGNIEGKGRVTTSAEHNFHCDSEAAYIALRELPQVNILPYEVCLRTELDWSVYDEWVKIPSDKAKFFKKITQHTITRLRENRSPGFRSCDLFAMVTILDRSAILEAKKVFATVELNGHWTRGQMVVDWLNKLENEATVNIVQKICTDKIVRLFSEALRS